jgi:alcohol dehydrogenase class IV
VWQCRKNLGMSEVFGLSRFPRHLLFGRGQRGALPAYVGQFGLRVLVVTDTRMAQSAHCSALVAAMKTTGLTVTLFTDIEPELPAECIKAGFEVGRGAEAEVIVGLGGGSCIDAAKVIAVLLTHGGVPGDYYGEFKVPGPVLPVIAVPTTSGTGSEVTPVAVVADPDKALKVGIASPHLIPHAAICDPDLTDSCPPALTKVSGADAMTHAIEAYTTLRRPSDAGIGHEHVFVGKNVLSDRYALDAIRLIARSLKTAYDDGSDRAARDDLMLGATLAGLAFGVAGTAAAHAIQYPIGALTHTPHGAGVAAMMPYVMGFNAAHAEAELGEIAKAMGLDVAGLDAKGSAQAAIEGVRELFASVGIPRTIRDLGVSEDQLEWTAEAALGAARLVKNNPRPLDADSILRLVRAAFDGDMTILQAE